MSVWNPGFYEVKPTGDEGTIFETITGSLQAFDNAATKAVEASRRDTSRAVAVFYHASHEDKASVRVGYAIAGRWFWRGQGIA